MENLLFKYSLIGTDLQAQSAAISLKYLFYLKYLNVYFYSRLNESELIKMLTLISLKSI